MIQRKPPAEIRVDDELTLKKLRLESAGVIFRSVEEDREHLGRWLPWVDQTRKESDTEAFIKATQRSTSAKKDLIYEIWYLKEFAGLIVLKEIDEWNRKTELGYWINSHYERLGLITRSCRALIDLAFTGMGMFRIQLKAAKGNARSCLVAERLNFKMEGIERAGEHHHSKYLDLVVYSLLRKEWVDGDLKSND